MDSGIPKRRTVIRSVHFLFAMTLAFRLIYLGVGLLESPRVPSGRIEIGYETGRIAKSLAEGRGFSSPLSVDTGPTAWITPIYPLLLAGIFKAFGTYTMTSSTLIRVLNCLFSALTIYPIFALGRRLFSPEVGYAAACFWALLPEANFFSTVWVWDTSLAALALASLVWATYALEERERPRGWAAYGALWAFGALTNAAILSVFPGLFGYAAYRARQLRASWHRLGAVGALAFALGVSPWIIRNEVVFHGQVFFRSNFGLEFWLGNNPEVPDSWTWWLHPNDNEQERAKFQSMGEVAYMQEKELLAWAFVKTHPADVARFTFHRFIQNWTGLWDPLADVWHAVPLSVKTLSVFNSLFALSALMGLLMARRTAPGTAFPLAFALLAFPAVYYITHTSLRYRHPIDPIMILLSTQAVFVAGKSLRKLIGMRRNKESAVLASNAAR